MAICKVLKKVIYFKCLIAFGFTFILISHEIVDAIDATTVELEGDLNQKITNLDFKNTDLKDLMRLIATKYNLNIFVDENIKLKLTMHLSDVTVGEAIQFILNDHNLMVEKYGSIYKISEKQVPDSLKEPKDKRSIKYQDGLLSVDVHQAEIQKTTYEISRISGVNIILDKSIQGNISGFIQDLPLQKALFHLFGSNGYFVEEVGGVIKIRPQNIYIHSDSTSYSNFWIHAYGDKIDIELSKVPLDRVIGEISRQVNSGFFFMDIWKVG